LGQLPFKSAEIISAVRELIGDPPKRQLTQEA
jgi:hypothetical protein